jgi:hypothetical protein
LLAWVTASLALAMSWDVAPALSLERSAFALSSWACAAATPCSAALTSATPAAALTWFSFACAESTAAWADWISSGRGPALRLASLACALASAARCCVAWSARSVDAAGRLEAEPRVGLGDHRAGRAHHRVDGAAPNRGRQGRLSWGGGGELTDQKEAPDAEDDDRERGEQPAREPPAAPDRPVDLVDGVFHPEHICGLHIPGWIIFQRG